MRTNWNIQTNIMAAVCATLITAAAPSVHAETVSHTVSLRGLNLRLTADQIILRHRIASAARKVCQEDFSVSDLHEVSDCEKAAFEDGWAQAEVRIAAASTNTMVASVSAR